MKGWAPVAVLGLVLLGCGEEPDQAGIDACNGMAVTMAAAEGGNPDPDQWLAMFQENAERAADSSDLKLRAAGVAVLTGLDGGDGTTESLMNMIEVLDSACSEYRE